MKGGTPDHHKEKEGSLGRGILGRGSILTAAAPTMTVAVAANSPPYATRPTPTSACCPLESGGSEAESALEDVPMLSRLLPASSLAPVMHSPAALAASGASSVEGA